MKKFKKMRISGIEKKIVLLILVAILLVAGVFLAVTLAQSNVLAGLTAETNARQKSLITEATTDVVNTVIDENMSRATELEAEVTDERFRALSMQVRMMGDYAQKLFDDPDSFPRLPWARPDPALDGELSPQMIFAEGVEEDAVADRLGLLANMTDLILAICKTYETEGAYIGIPEGVMLSVNNASGEWVREDGSYVTFDPRARYWYRQAVEEGGLVFTDVETDHATGKMCITCALPIYDENGTLLAVAGADLFLTELQQTVAQSAKRGGYLAVINQYGHVILSPKQKGTLCVQNAADAPDLRESDNPTLSLLIRDALQGKTNMRLVRLDDSISYMVGVPMRTAGWALISVYSQESARKPVQELRDDFQGIQEEASTMYRTKSEQFLTIILVALVVLLAALLIGALLAGRGIAKPLNTITERISGISGEDLEFRMEDDYRTGDEVEELAQSFAALSHKTVEYVEEVKRVTAEKERIGTELHMATEIQKGVLPDAFPAFPERDEFDLYATMNPAREVGGDFYDFFLIDDDHLAIVVADVSGKGIPAALFMMISKAILKSSAMMGISPGEILTKTNDTVCSNNKMQMFVTVWLGILEISTGRITAANAGHEYPAIRRAGGTFELYKDRHGFVLGGMEGLRYRDYELVMKPGDKLFLYTDGVTEATNTDRELFGTGRMLEALNEYADEDPASILSGVRRNIDAFAGEEEQFDDLTMLCLAYRGNA